jgi:hypothetical protein
MFLDFCTTVIQQEGLFIAPKETFIMHRRQERDRGFLYVLKINSSSEWYLMRNDNEAPHYAIFPILWILHIRFEYFQSGDKSNKRK